MKAEMRGRSHLDAAEQAVEELKYGKALSQYRKAQGLWPAQRRYISQKIAEVEEMQRKAKAKIMTHNSRPSTTVSRPLSFSEKPQKRVPLAPVHNLQRSVETTTKKMKKEKKEKTDKDGEKRDSLPELDENTRSKLEQKILSILNGGELKQLQGLKMIGKVRAEKIIVEREEEGEFKQVSFIRGIRGTIELMSVVDGQVTGRFYVS